jgi:hypothetical protein
MNNLPTDSPGPSEELREKNREVLAERLGYPAGTVEAEREIERACPGYFAWYSDGTLQEQPPRYGARKRDATFRDPTFYAETPAGVIAAIRSAK